MIGTILPWFKSANTPSLNPKWVECNGQTLSDDQSPYNGQGIPNLNGSTNKRFLSGSTTSGSTGGAESSSHTHTLTGGQTGGGSPAFQSVANSPIGGQTISIIPAHFEVVYIIKIKN